MDANRVSQINSQDVIFDIPDTGNLLPRFACQILSGDKAGINLEPAEGERRAILSMVNAGFNLLDIMQLLVTFPGLGYCRNLLDENTDDAVSWIEEKYGYALNRSKHDSESKIKAKSLLEWANNRPWKGRTGSSDKAVYVAICKLAVECGKLNLHASARDVSERANVTPKTASKAISRLIEQGLLGKLAQGRGIEAHVYYLKPDKITNITTSISEDLDDYSHDAFHHSALGRTGGTIFYALGQNTSLTAAEISSQTGLSRSTVYKHLNNMRNIGLVTKTSRRWSLIHTDLVKVSDVFGTTGNLVKKIHTHEQQRYSFRIGRRKPGWYRYNSPN